MNFGIVFTIRISFFLYLTCAKTRYCCNYKFFKKKEREKKLFTVFVIQLICNSKISIKQHLAYKSVRIDIVIQFSL